MAVKTLGLEGKLDDYYRSVAFREPAILKDLRAETAKLGGPSQMQIGPEQGAFMAMLVKLSGARRIVEIGTFTGYSTLALALAADVRISAADVSAEWTAVARRYWAKAGVADRIDLSLDGGNALIERLLAGGGAATIDMMFIDADKTGYDSYYEGGLKLLRSGGFMLIDNVLWGGEVANPAKIDADTAALRTLNAKIAGDARVDISMVPICDGLTIARKK
jgi:predicted O-methyltransferase YrrM